MQRGTRAAWAALIMVLATALVLGDGAPSVAERAAPVRHATPLYHRTSFADPSVARYADGFVAVATGSYVRRAVARTAGGPWHPTRRALVRLPRWARSPGVWAPDLVKTRRGWLLYYAAVATRPNRRCIGVAVARHALDRFRPIGRHPLACPPRGAIDPSGFADRRGRFLIFKTQGLPATIRVLRLTRDGRHRAPHAQPRVVLRSRHIVENPVVVRHGRSLVLFTSEYYYGSCSYRTTWRRAHLMRGLRHAAVHSLLDRRHTRICGPGGADVARGGRGTLIYFHGWRHARRVLFAAHLRWRHGVPRAGVYVRRS